MCTDLKKNRYRKNYVLFLLCKWLVLVTFVFWYSINLALLNLEVSRTEGWMVALILLIIFSYWGFNLFKIEKDLGINTKKNNVILPPTNVHIEKTEDVSENISPATPPGASRGSLAAHASQPPPRLPSAAFLGRSRL